MCIRDSHLAVDNPSFLQSFPDGDWVDVVKTILFFFGIKPFLLNELGKPALYLSLIHICDQPLNQRTYHTITAVYLKAIAGRW